MIVYVCLYLLVPCVCLYAVIPCSYKVQLPSVTMSLLQITPRNTPVARRTRNGSMVKSGKGLTVNGDALTKPYILDKKRAVVKKLEHTNRPHIHIWNTAGGIRGNFSAAFFEVLKPACQQHFSNLKADIRCKITPVIGGNRNLVETRYTVTSSSCSKLYVLNLYSTSSGMLVNGSNLHAFLDTDLPARGDCRSKYGW
jgi:hypothetical protein